MNITSETSTLVANLLKVYKALDKAVDKLYRKHPFADDTERVAFLFEKYEALDHA